MYYPTLRPRKRKRYVISRFGGYDHRPAPREGSFCEMRNLSGQRAPHLCVRGRRLPVDRLDGCPAGRVMALGGGKTPVLLDAGGALWCGGEVLYRFLGGNTQVAAAPEEGTVLVLRQARIVSQIPADGVFRFVYDRENELWRCPAEGFVLQASDLVLDPQQDEGSTVELSLSTTPPDLGERQLCFLGGWVCVFPDGRYANTVRLRQGAEMIEGEDYGSIALENRCGTGTVRFTPCGIDGTAWNVTCSDTAPESGFWVDTSEPEPVMRCRSASQGLWTAVNPYVKCEVPGIARGLSAGDGVKLFSRLRSEETDSDLAEDLWFGDHLLSGVWHDPGVLGGPEGSGDYVIFPGLLTRPITLELGAQEQRFLELRRELPEMDFVLSCQNRLWGCRYGNGVNELYACRLGDFRNWGVFAGLSTDSWRSVRGQDGPFTGAAVLGGCPLFFRENGLEKVFPAAGGDHSVATRSLCGIEQGSHKSAVVIRDRLYYNSPQGVCRFSGTLPEIVSDALGPRHWENAVAGALGRLYYVFLELPHEERCLFVYDTESGLWHKEDELPVTQFWSGGAELYYLGSPKGPLGCIRQETDSDGVRWYAETGDLLPRLGLRRYLSRLRITARLDPGAEFRVFVSCDGGPWERKGSFFGNRTRSLVFPVWPRRCDRLRLRFEGSGGMELQQISFLVEAGSDE